MSELMFELVENILMKLEVEDLIRCKSVCKSWLSLISSSYFVKTHLDYACNKDRNNHELGHRRIIMASHSKTSCDLTYVSELWSIVGSSNGLVCGCPIDDQVLVTNPSTREVRKLQPPPKYPNISMEREFLCWGFGHDSSTDDYKVVLGIKMRKSGIRSHGTLFHVLSLKLNMWRIVRLVNYTLASTHFGILLNGALHWFMKDVNTRKMVILSFDLSREEFREIPQPDDSRYICYKYFNCLGVVEECLCTFRNTRPYQDWVMKNYNDKDSWELLPYNCEMNKYDAAHTLKYNLPRFDFNITPFDQWCLWKEKGICFSKTADYICAPIFVKSLVSPHVNGKPKKKMLPDNSKRSVNYIACSRERGRRRRRRRRRRIER